MRSYKVVQASGEEIGVWPEDALVHSCSRGYEAKVAAERIRSMILGDQALVDRLCVLGHQARTWRAERPWHEVRAKVHVEVAAAIESNIRGRAAKARAGLELDSWVDALLAFNAESVIAQCIRESLNSIDWHWIADTVVMGELDRLMEKELHDGI